VLVSNKKSQNEAMKPKEMQMARPILLAGGGGVGVTADMAALLCCAVLCCVTGKVSIEMYSKADGIEAYVFEDKIEDADAGGENWFEI
jgi:hypothetical protein